MVAIDPVLPDLLATGFGVSGAGCLRVKAGGPLLISSRTRTETGNATGGSRSMAGSSCGSGTTTCSIRPTTPTNAPLTVF